MSNSDSTGDTNSSRPSQCNGDHIDRLTALHRRAIEAQEEYHKCLHEALKKIYGGTGSEVVPTSPSKVITKKSKGTAWKRHQHTPSKRDKRIAMESANTHSSDYTEFAHSPVNDGQVMTSRCPDYCSDDNLSSRKDSSERPGTSRGGGVTPENSGDSRGGSESRVNSPQCRNGDSNDPSHAESRGDDDQLFTTQTGIGPDSATWSQIETDE